MSLGENVVHLIWKICKSSKNIRNEIMGWGVTEGCFSEKVGFLKTVLLKIFEVIQYRKYYFDFLCHLTYP